MEKPLPTPNSISSLEDILEGSILLVDKPLKWTSFDVVGRLKWFIRHHLNAPKFKIGHAGTLDPLATGLLVICTGKCTKMIDQIMVGEKRYTGTIRLGQTTPSYDLETAPEGDFAIDHITEVLAEQVAQSFVGTQLQTPPIYSAKQIDGKRAYESARAGIEIKMRQAEVTIHHFRITRFELPEVDFDIACSKGTYIRSIANDSGQRLNSGSHLISLRRTASLPFEIGDSMSMEELESMLGGLSKK